MEKGWIGKRIGHRGFVVCMSEDSIKIKWEKKKKTTTTSNPQKNSYNISHYAIKQTKQTNKAKSIDESIKWF